jgi:hypothetical protein
MLLHGKPVTGQLAARPALQMDAVATRVEQVCSGCGFCSEELRARDGAVALSSLPRWWRHLFSLDRDRDLLGKRVGDQYWSALEHGAHVRDMLRAKANRVERIHHGDGFVVDDVVVDAPRAGDNDGDADLVLDVLGQNSIRFVKLVIDMTPEAWSHTGSRNGHDANALEVVREAVHEGVHHLRDARGVLVQLGVTPVRDEVDQDIWGRSPVST